MIFVHHQDGNGGRVGLQDGMVKMVVMFMDNLIQINLVFIDGGGGGIVVGGDNTMVEVVLTI